MRFHGLEMSILNSIMNKVNLEVLLVMAELQMDAVPLMCRKDIYSKLFMWHLVLCVL
tara:strand:- start:12355 stop:12525 length:171 start_codon:yes stop_codon:yes gene_type:complete